MAEPDQGHRITSHREGCMTALIPGKECDCPSTEYVPVSSLTALADEWEKRADEQEATNRRSKGRPRQLRLCAIDLRDLLASRPGCRSNNPTGGDDG